MQKCNLYMRYILTLVKVALSCVVVVLMSSCSNKGVIGKKTMVAIVQDMYLADQYIEMNPQMRAMTDTLRVYPAIFAKYGYTVEDYNNSLRYYLQKSDTYNKILSAASDDLEYRMKKLEREQEEEEMRLNNSVLKMKHWWALDSLKSVQAKDLVYDPLLRGVRWLVLQEEDFEVWTVLDSAVVDIPSNSQWWANNMGAAERSFSTFFVAPDEKPEVAVKKPAFKRKLHSGLKN